VTLVRVKRTAAAVSDTIGGGLLDDGTTGVCEGGRFGVYLDADRQAKGLPLNDRAAVLLARLGPIDRDRLAGLFGDALVVGIDTRGGDCDVPAGVLVAACQAGQRPVVDTDLGAPEFVPRCGDRLCGNGSPDGICLSGVTVKRGERSCDGQVPPRQL
jgi:hypothetical protein